MATAAFKSSTKRSTFNAATEDAGSSNRGGETLRRSRSLSRYSGRFPPPPPEYYELQAPRGRLNEVRDSGLPEISLDDLADEFFRRIEEGEVRPAVGRSGPRGSDVRYRAETDSSRRRGRSVSRHCDRAAGEKKGNLENSGESKGVPASRPRRQRSVSVARSRHRDSEEWEGTGLYETMHAKVNHPVEEIRTELEKVKVKIEHTVTGNDDGSQYRSSNVIQAIDEIRRNYTTKLEQSEKRRQDLLADLAVEEQRGQELMKVVQELLPAQKQTAALERPSWPTRRSNDRTRASKHLTEEAEKYFEDFLSSVGDTDLSSYDGERSDTSSTKGGSTKLRYSVIHNNSAETHKNLTNAASVPVETDGVVLPWLQWERNFPSPSKCKMGVSMASGNNIFDTSREVSAAYENSNCFTSSRGSWSPEELSGSRCDVSRVIFGSRVGEVGSHISSCSVGRPKGSFDMDEYAHLQHVEDLLFERLRQRQRINSGGLILCGRT